jgi:hypothetical protein
VRTETSTLASLHELRSIEKQRVTEERAARDRDRQVREDLAREVGRRAEAEAEAEAAAARAAQARRDAEVAAVERERVTAIEVAAAEARVRADAELAATRLAAELELRRARVERTRPVALIAVLAALLLGATGLAVWIVQQRNELADTRTRIQATERDAEAAQAKARDADNWLHAQQQVIQTLQQNVAALRAEAAAKEHQHALVAPPPVRPSAPPAVRPVTPHQGPIVVPPECEHSALCFKP